MVFTLTPPLASLVALYVISTVVFLSSTLSTLRHSRLYTSARTYSFLLLFAAWLLFTAGCITSFYAAFLPITSPSVKETWMKLMLWEVIGFGTSLWLAKASLMAIYWGLFESLRSRMKWGLVGGSVYVVGTWVVLIVSLLAWCAPDVWRIWAGASLPLAQRCNPIDYTLSLSHLQLYTVLNTTSDGVVLFIPLLIFSTHRLDSVDIFALIFLLCLGFLTVSTTIIRTVLMSTQTQWTLGFLQLGETLVIVECAAAIIAASLPGLRSEIRTCWGRRKSVVWGGPAERMNEGRVVPGPYSFKSSLFKSASTGEDTYRSSIVVSPHMLDARPASEGVVAESVAVQVIPNLTPAEEQRLSAHQGTVENGNNDVLLGTFAEFESQPGEPFNSVGSAQRP